MRSFLYLILVDICISLDDDLLLNACFCHVTFHRLAKSIPKIQPWKYPNQNKMYSRKPDSCFLRMPSEFLTSHGCFRSECFAGVEHKSTDAKYLLKIGDVKMRIAFAGSINRAWIAYSFYKFCFEQRTDASTLCTIKVLIIIIISIIINYADMLDKNKTLVR